MPPKSKPKTSNPRAKAREQSGANTKSTRVGTQPGKKPLTTPADKSLNKSEQQFRNLFESLPIGFGVADLQGNLLAYNNAMLQPGGYSQKDIKQIGNVAALYYSASDRENILKLYAEQGEVKKQPVKFKRKDGTPYDILLTLTPTTFRGQICIQAMAEDLTERKRLEANLRESQSKFRDLVERLPQVIYSSEMGANGVWEYVSPQIEGLLGFSAEEWMADPSSWERQVHPADLGDQQSLEDEALRHNNRFEGEYRMFTRDGREIWVHDVGHIRIRDGGRQPIVEGLLMDITERKRIEQELQGAQAKYRQLVEHIPAITYTAKMDRAHTRLYVSPQIESMLGVSQAEYLSSPTLWQRMLHPDDRERVLAAARRFYETGKNFVEDYRSVANDGRVMWFHDEATFMTAADGGELFIQGIKFDITTRKLAEESVRESEQRYHTLVDGMLDGVYRSTHDGRFLDVNPTMLKLFGYDSREQMLALDIKKDLYFAPEERDSLFLDTGQEKVDEFRMKRRDGSEIWVEDHGRYVHDAQGNVVYHEGILRDITERKRAERDLQQSEQKYRALAEQVPAVIYTDLATGSGETIYISPHVEKMLGYSAHDWIVDPDLCNRIMHPEDSQRAHLESENSQANGRYSLDYRYMTKDGHIVWVRDEAVLLRDAAGQPKFWQGVMLDITAQKDAEDALRESQARLSLFFNQSLDGFFFSMLEEPKEWKDSVDKEAVLDYVLTHQHITEVNDAMLGQYGATRADFIGRTASHIFAHDIEQARGFRRRLFDEGRLHIETEERRDDGTPIWLEGDYVCMSDAQGRISGMFGIQRDITARRHAENMLLQFRNVMDESNDAVFMIDPQDGHYLDFNRKACTYLGYNQEELSRLGVIDIAEHIPNQRKWKERADLISVSNGLTFETRYKRKDGTIFSVEVSARMLEYSGREIMVAIVRDITERKKAEGQIRDHIQHLTSLHTVDSVINASFDLGIVSDVLLEQVINQLRVDAADLLILNHESLTLYYHAGRGFQSHLARDRAVRLGEGVAGMVAMERRSVRISQITDLPADKNFVALWQTENLKDYVAIPLVAKGQVKGILEVFHRQPLELDAALTDFLETLASQAAIAIDNAQLFERLQRTNLDLSMAYDATIEGWSRAMDLRDHATEGHTRRVTDLTLDLARFMNIPGGDLIHMYRGALLHDIGKMSTPDSILFKSGPLSTEEIEIMRKHPLHAFNMLSPIEYLRPALDIPYCHHEKWDGTGYPRGLFGVEIPLAARIFAVADVWDALRSDRPYRDGWTEVEAEEYIAEQSRKYFDPVVVEAFIKMRRAGRTEHRDTP